MIAKDRLSSAFVTTRKQSKSAQSLANLLTSMTLYEGTFSLRSPSGKPWLPALAWLSRIAWSVSKYHTPIVEHVINRADIVSLIPRRDMRSPFSHSSYQMLPDKTVFTAACRYFSGGPGPVGPGASVHLAHMG
jgi:hypothetical protein